MGRAEKYANVVDDYENKLEEAEEKLSVTRELKFGDLQKDIDNSVTVADYEEMDNLDRSRRHKNITDTSEIQVEDAEDNIEDTEDIPVVKHDTAEIEKIKEELLSKEKLEDTKETKLLDEDTAELIAVNGEKEDKNEDDLFLTMSMDPIKKKPRLKKVFRILLVLIIVIILGLLIAFKVVKPIINNVINGDPKKVYENSIDYITNNTNNLLKEYMSDGSLIYYDFSAKTDDITYGYKYGLDKSKNILLKDYYINNGSTYDFTLLEDGGVAYKKYSNYDKYMILGKVAEDSAKTDLSVNIMNALENNSKDDMTYFTTKLGEYFKDSLEDDMFTKASEEIEINDKEVKVIDNKLDLTKDNKTKVVNNFNKKLNEDEKFKKIYQEIFGESLELSNKVIHIYTKQVTNKFMGFDIEENGFVVAYMYIDGNNYNIHLNLNDECIIGKTCNNSTNKDLVIDSKDNNVTIKYNNKETAKLVVREFNLEKIDLDYTYNDNNGSLVIEFNNTSNAINYNFSMTNEDIKYSGSLEYNKIKSLSNVNDDETIELSAKEEEDILNEFKTSMNDDTLYENFNKWIDFVNSPFATSE